MKCKKVRKELTAYLDGELKDKKRRIISEHLEGCPDCKKEFIILSQQDELLGQMETIEPSVNFRAQFWQKVRTIEISAEAAERSPRFGWLPVPAMIFLVILIAFHLFTFSFSVFARDQDLRNQVTSQVVKDLIIPSHPINPVSLLRFCKGCYKTLCNCAQKQGVSSKCVCGNSGGER